jgi:hypothetical protein
MKHELIKTEDYLLVVGDKEIEKYDWVFHPTYKSIYQWIENAKIKFDRIDAKKIIAHLPLDVAPYLDGVDVLPLLDESFEGMMQSIVSNDDASKEGFILGWHLCKRTYKYTEEDLIKAIDMATTCKHEGTLLFFNANEIIQYLQQSKIPKYFEVETITMNEGYTDKSDYPYQEVGIPKTITNSEGRTEWVGKYEF